MILKRKNKPRLVINLLVLSFTILSMLFTLYPARAQEPGSQPDNTPGEVVTPSALELLKGMSDTLGAAKEFSFDAEVTFDEVLASGQKVQFGGTVKALVKRPGSVYTEFTGDLAKKKIWFSGKTVTVLDEDHNFYGELQTPEGIDPTMDFMMENYGFSLPLADIFHSDPYGSFTTSTVDGVYVGDSQLRGAQCSHLSFIGEHADWQLWISNEKPALPCKLVITYKDVQGGPQYEAIFSNWNLNPSIPDTVFKPDTGDAEKIDFAEIKKASGEKK